MHPNVTHQGMMGDALQCCSPGCDILAAELQQPHLVVHAGQAVLSDKAKWEIHKRKQSTLLRAYATSEQASKEWERCLHLHLHLHQRGYSPQLDTNAKKLISKKLFSSRFTPTSISSDRVHNTKHKTAGGFELKLQSSG